VRAVSTPAGMLIVIVMIVIIIIITKWNLHYVSVHHRIQFENKTQSDIMISKYSEH